MMYLYIKAIHIIFIVTWFSGIFYIPRLFIYEAEANEREEPARSTLLDQFRIMSRRLWYGITWPSAILTLIFGTWLAYMQWPIQQWLWVKLVFVAGLYTYHFSLHLLFRQHQRKIFRYSSQQLRLWNEVATIFLVAIVMLASVKDSLSFIWGLAGLSGFIIILFLAIRIYKFTRDKKGNNKS